MVFSHRKLFGICTFPKEFFLQGEKQDCKEERPLHMDWGQPLQTKPESNYEKVCQGGEIL